MNTPLLVLLIILILGLCTAVWALYSALCVGAAEAVRAKAGANVQRGDVVWLDPAGMAHPAPRAALMKYCSTCDEQRGHDLDGHCIVCDTKNYPINRVEEAARRVA